LELTVELKFFVRDGFRYCFGKNRVRCSTCNSEQKSTDQKTPKVHDALEATGNNTHKSDGGKDSVEVLITVPGYEEGSHPAAQQYT
jgi:hypothetical protein